MKSRTIVIKRKYLLFALVLSIVLFICSFPTKKNIETPEENIIENTTMEVNVTKQNPLPSTVSSYKTKEAYTSMPENVDGYEVIGRLQIPKIKLDTYVLSETTKNTLNKSVTKLCGPKVNGVGNLCITGHNYINDKMFSKLKKLENNDKILVTDIYDNTVEYVVYDTYKVEPDEVECLSQETEGEREITLITCTTGAIKRLIVKAIENYD
ncbi:MAG: sortase [Clostridia bacterium]|nr:sortase [Clostridia bacterium]